MNKNINHFSHFHPVTLLFYFILIIIMIFMCDYAIILIYAFISFSLCTIYIEGIKAYIKALIYYIMLMFMAGFFNCCFNHSGENVFLYINDTPLTLDSLFYGIYTGVMVSCLLMWFKLFNHSMDNGKINYIIGKHLPVTGLIISMCFSFTKRFKYKLDIIKQSLYTLDNSRLIAKKCGTGRICILIKEIFYKVKNGAVTLNTLMNVMLYDSILTADSMTARGYGLKHRKLYKRYTVCTTDVIFTIIALLLFISALFFRLFIIPLILAPVIYNIFKEISWKYYQWKI